MCIYIYMTGIHTHKIMLCLASGATQFTLHDDINNGGGGFSISHMRIASLYYKRSTENLTALKCLNIKINNIDDVLQDFNTVKFYDGINSPNTSFFSCILSETSENSIIVYNNSTRWHYVSKTLQSENIKNLEILIYEGDQTTLCSDININNRLYLELEFY